MKVNNPIYPKINTDSLAKETTAQAAKAQATTAATQSTNANSNAAAAKAAAEAAKNNTATNNTASATGILSQKLSHVINLASDGVIKSIQTGLISDDAAKSTDSQFGDTGYNDYTITPVNIGKTVVLGSASSSGSPFCARLINSTTLRVYPTYYIGGNPYIRKVAWQLIEFK